jgi:hypothetical protein
MWSKLVDYGVGIVAKDYYDANSCQYHNWQHILDCYSYLEKTKVPYVEALDWAVLFHDIVYDDQPNKEKRSADLFMQIVDQFANNLLNKDEKWFVYDLILATATHKCDTGPNQDIINALIRADLHQLGNPKLSILNYSKILNESIKLYGIDAVTFARNNFTFMKTLEETVIKNYNIDYNKFWLDVLAGIRLTQDISSAVIKHF